MNRYRFAPQVSMVMGFLFVSPCLLAQPHADVTIHGRVYYSGRHSGPIHIAAGEDWRLAGQVTIPGPGPYSLTIPNALAGHSYVVLAQMDLDGSGLTMDSFLVLQRYESSRKPKRPSDDPIGTEVPLGGHRYG
ncbi:MAG: hypothetical protein MUC88_00830, partial [Planctomycetes bacterium]|nr:hypothetical protein [Planctomycetota bacterium]